MGNRLSISDGAYLSCFVFPLPCCFVLQLNAHRLPTRKNCRSECKLGIISANINLCHHAFGQNKSVISKPVFPFLVPKQEQFYHRLQLHPLKSAIFLSQKSQNKAEKYSNGSIRVAFWGTLIHTFKNFNGNQYNVLNLQHLVLDGLIQLVLFCLNACSDPSDIT